MNDTSSADKPQEPASGHGEGGGHEHLHINIQIDREHIEVEVEKMTGSQLRSLPKTPIGPERDLFQVVPGGQDVKIGDDQVVRLKSGMRFFTAPGQINPGSH